MRLWVFSDIHLEFEPYFFSTIPQADVCVCAGDVTNGGILPSLEWLSTLAKIMPVVMVAGNHEFYNASIVESFEQVRSDASKRAKKISSCWKIPR